MVGQKVGVIGHPVSQSLSPFLHQRWMEHFGLEAEYLAIDGENNQCFQALLKDLPREGYLGVNVTIPFKEEALSAASAASKLAQRVGAANLLLFKDGDVIADNTDVDGFAKAINSLELSHQRAHARILGAGGAAPAVIVALQQLGVGHIEITNRTASKAMEKADRFGIDFIDWDDRSKGLGGIDLLINTTSLGMKGQPPLEIDIHELPASATVVDIVTTPPETPLLAQARNMGLKVMNGLPMLVYQAIPSFQAWFGLTPPSPGDDIAFLARGL